MKPVREHATNNAQTYFVTAKTWESRALFRAEPWARLFFQNLLSHRNSYLLHEFVLMPDHFHLLISPYIPLERAIQFVKGGLSYRAKKELGSNAEIWQRGFSDHRIRDCEDYERHVQYIHLNSVKKHLCERPEQYSYSSAFPGWKLDPIPQGLKPTNSVGDLYGTTKVVPFQNDQDTHGIAEAVHFQSQGRERLKPTEISVVDDVRAEARTLQAEISTLHSDASLTSDGTAEVVPFQNDQDTHGIAEAVHFQSKQSSAMSSEISAAKEVEKIYATQK